MPTARISYRAATLETARECALLGAHARTIASITGLAPSFIRSTVFENRSPLGRPNYNDAYIFVAPLRFHAEACSIALHYENLVKTGFQPAHALITAFRHHATVAGPEIIRFDGAFRLIARLHGLWGEPRRTLYLVGCVRCASFHFTTAGPGRVQNCRFCNVILKARRDNAGRVVDAERRPTLSGDCYRDGSVGRAFASKIDALRFLRSLQALGAHARVVSALMSTYPDAPESLRGASPDALVTVRQPLSLHRWTQALPLIRRAGYGLVAKHFRDLVARGFSAEISAVAAHVHVSALCTSALSFNRCFEVISLLSARWGVREPALRLGACKKCGAEYLYSLREQTRAHCSFCSLARLGRRSPPETDSTDPSNEAVSSAIST